MDQKQEIPANDLDNIYWLKQCFLLRKEMRVLAERNKTELFIFMFNLLLSEEEKIWDDLEEELKEN